MRLGSRSVLSSKGGVVVESLVNTLILSSQLNLWVH
jgi:hypothetical protein